MNNKIYVIADNDVATVRATDGGVVVAYQPFGPWRAPEYPGARAELCRAAREAIWSLPDTASAQDVADEINRRMNAGEVTT